MLFILSQDADMMIDDKFFRKVQPNCWSPEERIKDMDETGKHLMI